MDNLQRKMIVCCHINNLCHLLGVQKFECLKSVKTSTSAPILLFAYLDYFSKVCDQFIQTSHNIITGITPAEESWLAEFSSCSFGFDFNDIYRKKVINVFTHRKKVINVFINPAGLHTFFLWLVLTMAT